ncbi:unnamed protein product [Cunninghamella blakesleeana]
MSTIEERLKKILVEQMGLHENIIKENTRIAALEIDSLDFVEILIVIEKEFDIDIHDDDAAKFTNIQSIIDYIENYQK